MVPLFRSRALIASACAFAALVAGIPAAVFGLPAVSAAPPEGATKIAPANANAGADRPQRRRERPRRSRDRARHAADVHDVVAAKARRVAARARRPKRVAVPPELQSIAQCESGGNPRSVSADGTYRGKYQFSRDTWAAMGGEGDPAQAPEGEQDRRAIALYNQSGPGQWPVCSR